MEKERKNASVLLNKMKNIWEKLKELYDQNPTLFGILLFIDLTILYFIIQYIIS
jgi:hypothetical protein